MEEKMHNEHEDQFGKEKRETEGQDEDYGLPEVSYDPVNRENKREPIIMNPKDQQNLKNTYKKESSWPMVIGILVIVILVGVFVYLFLIKSPEQTVTPIEEARPPVVQNQPPVEEEIPDASAFENTDDSSWETPSEPAKPAKGVISTISSRTGKAYIVAGSFIDVDLARDYGNKLAGEGVSTTIIPPYGEVKYYRLSIADYPTVGEALENLDNLKTKYGENIWVLKY